MSRTGGLDQSQNSRNLASKYHTAYRQNTYCTQLMTGLELGLNFFTVKNSFSHICLLLWSIYFLIKGLNNLFEVGNNTATCEASCLNLWTFSSLKKIPPHLDIKIHSSTYQFFMSIQEANPILLSIIKVQQRTPYEGLWTLPQRVILVCLTHENKIVNFSISTLLIFVQF